MILNLFVNVTQIQSFNYVKKQSTGIQLRHLNHIKTITRYIWEKKENYKAIMSNTHAWKQPCGEEYRAHYHRYILIYM